MLPHGFQSLHPYSFFTIGHTEAARQPGRELEWSGQRRVGWGNSGRGVRRSLRGRKRLEWRCTAGNGTRIRNPQLGKLMLCQLSNSSRMTTGITPSPWCAHSQAGHSASRQGLLGTGRDGHPKASLGWRDAGRPSGQPEWSSLTGRSSSPLLNEPRPFPRASWTRNGPQRPSACGDGRPIVPLPPAEQRRTCLPVDSSRGESSGP